MPWQTVLSLIVLTKWNVNRSDTAPKPEATNWHISQNPTTPSLNRYITNQEAYRGHRIQLAPGLGVNISFIPVDEKVRRLWLDDLSEIVVDVDVPLPNAQVIHLKRIAEIPIPFQSRSPLNRRTLMTVITNKNIYQFIIELTNYSTYQTIHIIPANEQTLQIDENTIARISHVEKGLEWAIQNRRILANSELVLRVREFIAAVRMGKPIYQAAQEQELYMSFIYELAKIGLKKHTFPFQKIKPNSEENPTKNES